jgi:succinate dehydrogenase flavin-adding protein (antitoxin of CptAB toxin-antitoxin module)
MIVDGYALQEVGWEYNDEYYLPIDGGNVKKVFFNKERAEKECFKKTIELCKKEYINLADYLGYDCDHLSDEDLEKISEIFGEKYDNIYSYVLETRELTEEQIEQVLKILQITFFNVVEVEIES